MKDLKTNIKFNYLYRDSGNYKNWDYVVFSNPLKETLEEIETQIRTSLVDSEFFYAEKLDIPILYFEDHFDDIDHQFHEYESVEETEEKVTDKKNRTISKLIDELKNSN